MLKHWLARGDCFSSCDNIIFLFGYASRPENDIGSSVSTAPRGVHAAAADYK